MANRDDSETRTPPLDRGLMVAAVLLIVLGLHTTALVGVALLIFGTFFFLGPLVSVAVFAAGVAQMATAIEIGGQRRWGARVGSVATTVAALTPIAFLVESLTVNRVGCTFCIASPSIGSVLFLGTWVIVSGIAVVMLLQSARQASGDSKLMHDPRSTRE